MPKKSTSSKKKAKQPIIKLQSSPELAKLVDDSINDMEAQVSGLKAAGMSEEEARKFIQQRYFQNLSTFSDPYAASVSLMADLKTRIDAKRHLEPGALIDDEYLELLEELRKTVKLVSDTKGKTVNHAVNVKDDREMKFTEFIDVEDDDDVNSK